MKIIFASKNFGKTQEIQEMLKAFPLKNLQDYGVGDDCEETGETFEENAQIKVEFYVDILKNHEEKFVVLSDDSGILVDALPGELGVKTRRWGAGEKASDEVWMDFFLNRMREFEGSARRARFVSVAALWHKGEVQLFRGEVSGVLAHELQAPMIPGVGLSSLFIPDGFDTVFSLLSAEEKNSISHRGKAFAQVQDFLQKLL